MKQKKKYRIALIVLVLLIAGVAWAASVTQTYSANTAMTVTNLHSLGSSATVGWQSDVIDNRTTAALDYQINVKLDMANTAKANDEAVYVYIVPAYNDGAWNFNDGGTATLPSGSEAAYTIGAQHNLVLAAVLHYETADQVIQKTFNIGAPLGYRMVDGFSLVIINFSGAALAGSANEVNYKSIAGDVS